MKPSAREKQQRAEAKRDRRRRRRAKAPVKLKSPCPKCGFPTPDLVSGGFVRCLNCGSVKG